MRRTRRGRQDHSHQIHERWTLRPFHDQNQETVDTEEQPDLETPSSLPSTSHLNLEPTTSVPISEFIPKTWKRSPNRRNSKWVSRNRRGRAFKNRLVKVGPPSSGKEENWKEEGEEEEGKGGDGHTSTSKTDSNGERVELAQLGSPRSCEEDEVRKEEKEKYRDGCALASKNDLDGETIEGSDSIIGVDDIGSRLEELLLGAEEPELSEELLKINDQLQEDEVI